MLKILTNDLFVGWLVVINLLAVVIMGLDKQAAKHKKHRVAEKVLFLVAFAGGEVGIFIAMLLFRHKTKHRYFYLILLLILIVHIGLIYLLTCLL